MTASSFSSWSRFSPPSNFINRQASTVWFMVCRWRHRDSHRAVKGRDPFVQVSTKWALTCPETVHQRSCVPREMETWLSDSRVGNNSVSLTTEADDQSSLHCVTVADGLMFCCCFFLASRGKNGDKTDTTLCVGVQLQ